VELLLAIVSGVLYATGLYLMLRRRLAQVIIGLALLSHGSNLLIFTAAGLTRNWPPLIREEMWGASTQGASLEAPPPLPTPYRSR
jgi:multicomponent Na+:H+ antiporter subunit C